MSSENVVPLPFRRKLREVIPEAPLPVMPGFGHGQQRGPIAVSNVDLSGKPKVWCLIGAGSTGKTLLARWLIWRMTEQGRQAELAALDPANRSLPLWFENVHVPEQGADSALWLRDLLDFVSEEKRNAVLDFGGGDTSLARLLDAEPDLDKRMAEAGVTMVPAILFAPRVDDLSILQTLDGFGPGTTLLLLNEGRKDSTLQAEDAFGPVLNHSVFKKAIARGAAALWMPALEPDVMQEIEQKRLHFGMARDGLVPEGATFHPIGGLRRSSVGRWLKRMDDALAPCSTWLP